MASPEFAVLDLELDAYRRRVNAYAKTRDERRQRGDTADGPSSVVLASNLLYLTPDQRAELNNGGSSTCCGTTNWRTRTTSPKVRSVWRPCGR